MSRFIPSLKQGAIALAIAGIVGVAGCGGGNDDDGDGRVAVGDTILLTTDNQVRSINRNTPENVVGRVSITGLVSGERLLGIDYRPANGLLYGLGSVGGIYTLDPATGVAARVSTLRADVTDLTAPFTALSGSDFGLDFNPLVDRLRVVSNTGQNLRINVDTGDTTTDTALNQSEAGVAAPAVTAAGYTNSFVGATATTLYVLDFGRGVLQVQNPPNNGTLATGVNLGFTGEAVNGFDIEARNNIGYVAVQTSLGVQLYRIDLTATANVSQRVGIINTADRIIGLALR